MKRFIYTSLLFVVFLSLVTTEKIFAQTPPATAGTSTWKNVSPSSFGGSIQGTDMNAQSAWHTGVQYSMYSLSCLGSGIDCTDKVEDTPANVCNSAFGKLNETMAMTFTEKPADFGLWLADTGHTLGFIPNQVYAQGIGFSGMQPLLPLWKAFRNIAYLLMAVIMIVLGFMIMFRKKIDPHTVITAQNAIPRVVIALILITFSYAIVGILIDFMYVLIYFLIALFKSTGLLDNPTWPSCLMYKTPEQLYGQGGLWANYFNLHWNPYKILFGWDVNPGALSTVLGASGIVLGLALGTTNPILGAGVGITGLFLPLLHLILTIAIIFLFIRLLFFFLGAYIQIIVSLLLAPLQLLFEAVPGSTAFASWISNLVSNLLVFPIGAAMFMLSNVFNHFANNSSTNAIWAPPYAPLSGNTSQISSIVAIGILFAIPQVAGSVKEMLKAKPLVGGAGAGGGAGSAMQWLSSAYYIRSFIPQEIVNRVFPKKEGGH